jgi:ABC-2 type transport system ATP-binding protein
VQITAHDAREVEAILGVLRNAGCQPEDLEIGRADLEDVFLEIMSSGTQTPRAAAASLGVAA